MRGKGLSDDGHFVAYRITPAYAGKSFRFFILEGLKEDHPRICGEKLISVKGESRPVGSPPHMRGKASVRSGTVRAGRITPAYAGKSTARRRAYLFFWDHPRICGEKPLEEHGGAVITGSPPHMRGKDIRGVVQNVLFGITPAYAGKRRQKTKQSC